MRVFILTLKNHNRNWTKLFACEFHHSGRFSLIVYCTKKKNDNCNVINCNDGLETILDLFTRRGRSIITTPCHILFWLCGRANKYISNLVTKTLFWNNDPRRSSWSLFDIYMNSSQNLRYQEVVQGSFMQYGLHDTVRSSIYQQNVVIQFSR